MIESHKFKFQSQKTPKKYNLPDPAEEQKKAEEQAKEQNAVKTEAVNNVNAMFQAFSQEIEAI